MGATAVRCDRYTPTVMSEAKHRRRTVLVCGLILAALAALAYSAASTKNATIDEPAHLVSGTLALRDGDYGSDVTNPPLWKMWAAVGDVGLPVRPADGRPPPAESAATPAAEVAWESRTLFDTPGNDGDRLVGRGRVAMLVVAVALGAAVAAWAYQLAGGVAAVVAVALFAFDPTLLAHAPLVKGDVAFALAYLGLGWLAWHAGRRMTVARAVGLGLVCGAAVNVKFSGVLTGPVLVALPALRAVGRTPWPAFGRVAESRAGRVGVAAVTAIIAAVVAVTFTWGCYRFRYAPSSAAGGAGLDVPAVVAANRVKAASAAVGRLATSAEVAAHPVAPLDRFVTWADAHRLLPQAFLAGLACQGANVLNWPAYLDGDVYAGGRASYYPLAWLYKTPLPEIAAFAAATVVAGVALVSGATRVTYRSRTPFSGGPKGRASSAGPARPFGPPLTGDVATRPGHGWTIVCLAVPAVVFAAAAVRTNLNVGLRSVLPLYPYAEVAAGVAAAWAWRRRPGLTAAVAGPLLAVMAVTAVAAWPDYLPFFNAAVGGPRPGLAHLADSNLDWGQDVRGLADWQRAHGGVPVYADLFMSVDPSVYGARVQWLWVPDGGGGERLNPPTGPAVLAISATHLVGLYTDPAQRAFLAAVADRPPIDVIHGSIYLFAYRP